MRNRIQIGDGRVKRSPKLPTAQIRTRNRVPRW